MNNDVYENLKFSVESRAMMEDIRNYLSEKDMDYTVVKDLTTYEFIFTLNNPSENEVEALDQYLKRKEVMVKMHNAGKRLLGVASTVTKTAATMKVASTVSPAAAKLTVDAVGKTAETITKVGASTVIHARETYRETARNLNNSLEVMEAKEIFSSGWDKLKQKLGNKKKSRF